jgi:2-oxoglutarate dehydrogenase E2 component (dihydrolipoamide succinyltransferase)
MSTFEILMPKMGESVEEATITKWFVKEGDTIEEDDPVLEIATDKVDSEIPSPVAGTVKEIKYEVDDVVAVGKPVAIILLEGEEEEDEDEKQEEDSKEDSSKGEEKESQTKETSSEAKTSEKESNTRDEASDSDRFYSPLVRSIAKEEGISFKELDTIEGSGRDGRVTKDDLLGYLKSGGKQSVDKSAKAEEPENAAKSSEKTPAKPVQAPKVTAGEDQFQEKYGEKLTFMPMFTEAVAKALRDFPGVNASVDGDNIILRKNVNVGIAVALPSGNLIVPVVKQADQKNVVGLATEMNRLAVAARNNKLSGDDIQGGTFTITNFGSFKNTIGTPIINQPQVAILATGTIEKKPAVIETPTGDVIAIRHKMFLSLSYDHRAVDGALGGMFVRRVADYLEEADIDREV